MKMIGKEAHSHFRWYNLDCAQQQEFYSLNQFLYQENEEDYNYDYDNLARGGKLSRIF